MFSSLKIPHHISMSCSGVGKSWTVCHDDGCFVHRDDKLGSNWFPRKPSTRRLLRITSRDDRSEEYDCGRGRHCEACSMVLPKATRGWGYTAKHVRTTEGEVWFVETIRGHGLPRRTLLAACDGYDVRWCFEDNDAERNYAPWEDEDEQRVCSAGGLDCFGSSCACHDSSPELSS